MRSLIILNLKFIIMIFLKIKQINIDILRHIEHLSDQINRIMAGSAKPVLRRYPLTFALLIVFGVVAVSEGTRGVLQSFGLFNNHPWYLLVTGLFILVVTGTLYKKLDRHIE